MRQCAEPDCRNISYRLRCQTCEAGVARARTRTRTLARTQRPRGSWARFAEKMRRHQPWCSRCGRGETDLAADGIRLAFDLETWTVRCVRCCPAPTRGGGRG